MYPFPTGHDRVFDEPNARIWMRRAIASHPALTRGELAKQAAHAFGVDSLLAAFDEGEHWIWDIAEAVLAEGSRKLRSTVTGRPQVYSAPSRFTSVIDIRRYGRIVAVDTAEGWKVRDLEGNLTLAAPDQARHYSSLVEWVEACV